MWNLKFSIQVILPFNPLPLLGVTYLAGENKRSSPPHPPSSRTPRSLPEALEQGGREGPSPGNGIIYLPKTFAVAPPSPFRTGGKGVAHARGVRPTGHPR